MIAPELEEAIVALVMDKFHATFDEIGDMTDRQLYRVVLHERDEHGQIAMPKVAAAQKPLTFEQAMLKVDEMAINFHLSPENVAEAKAKLREKYGKDG